jgi:hypothetical protein
MSIKESERVVFAARIVYYSALLYMSYLAFTMSVAS